MSEEPLTQPPSQPPASAAVIDSKQMPSSAEPDARPQRGGASFKEYMLRIAGGHALPLSLFSTTHDAIEICCSALQVCRRLLNVDKGSGRC